MDEIVVKKEETNKLTRPDGSDPEGFSRQVAQAYNYLLGTTSKPAKMLADEAGVPVVTVHRWIADARRRGFVLPGRQGVAGISTSWERVAAELGVTTDRLGEIIRRNAPGGLRLPPPATRPRSDHSK